MYRIVQTCALQLNAIDIDRVRMLTAFDCESHKTRLTFMSYAVTRERRFGLRFQRRNFVSEPTDGRGLCTGILTFRVLR